MDTDDKQHIDPWKVESESGINYMKLVTKFGCEPIDGKLIKRFEQVTKTKAHTWLRRGLFFSNKDLELCLKDYEEGKPIYIYTGRGPSSESMHLGHMIPFIFTKYLQEAFDAIVIIQLSDDEKYSFKGHIDNKNIDYYIKLTFENAKDIIACGFNPDKTFIFSNTNSMNEYLYKNIVCIDSTITGNAIKTIYGLDYDRKIGELSWPSKQCAPAFSSSFPDILTPNAQYTTYPDGTKTYTNLPKIRCLVPMAIDQRPYFAMARDIANKLKYLKPTEIHSEFLPSLNGINTKMSSTNGVAPIFLTDTSNNIMKKIKASFSGGKETKELHEKYGGNLNIDIAYQYLLYFLDDDEKLKNIAHEYSSGQMLTGPIKNILCDIICDFIKKHQEERNKVTQSVLEHYFKRNRTFNYNRNNKQDIILNTDEEYLNMGINFDRYFGVKNI